MNLNTLLDRYLERHAHCPDVESRVAPFRSLLAHGAIGFHREHFRPGHFTASAWLVHRDQKHVLLTHHRKLGRWLQLGGHADGERDLCAVALREAEEESGLDALKLLPEIFDLDVHSIPARGADPEHLHLDVRFVVLHQGQANFKVSAESLALAWRPVLALCGNDTEASIRRMASLWLDRGA